MKGSLQDSYKSIYLSENIKLSLPIFEKLFLCMEKIKIILFVLLFYMSCFFKCSFM